MECELIEWLTARIAHLQASNAVTLGIGDDAALLRFDDVECVATTDMLMDGVDFVVSQHALERIGRKALAVNLSDLAAMAANPVAALVNLALPQANALSVAQRLFEGIIPLAEQFGVTIAGGDTNCWTGPLVISITAFGRVARGRALRRRGAQPGDHIIVTGAFGGSLAGKHFDFTPRVREAQLLNERYELHAGCDVSDGLALDLHRLGHASGCGAMLVAHKIPLTEQVLQQYSGFPQEALQHALGDGEDFELLFAVSAETAARMIQDQVCDTELHDIGVFTAEPSFWLQHADGSRSTLEPVGYVHGKTWSS